VCAHGLFGFLLKGSEMLPAAKLSALFSISRGGWLFLLHGEAVRNRPRAIWRVFLLPTNVLGIGQVFWCAIGIYTTAIGYDRRHVDAGSQRGNMTA